MQFNEGSTFLFQGDSITDGGRGRTEDPNHILGHGYVFRMGYILQYLDMKLARL